MKFMLRIWLVIPVALAFLSLLTGLRIDYREQVARASGEAQILETLEFWVKHRGDRPGLLESLEILRENSGLSAIGLCHQGRRLVKVGDLRGDCNRPSESALVNFWQKRIPDAGTYAVMGESQKFSSLAGLLYFMSFVLFSIFVLFSFMAASRMHHKKAVSSLAVRPGRAKLCLRNENQLEI